MGSRKSVQQIWRDTESGLVVPDGTVSDLSLSSSQTYLRIKEKALAVEELYSTNNVPLNSASDIARLIADSKTLSDSWLIGQSDKYSMALLFRVGFFNRIADSVLPLCNVADRSRFLRILASGSLNLLERKRSTAKDILWELEMWEILKRQSFNAILEEPPDIVVEFDNSQIGIACKKLYSEKHVQNVLSQAVAQIEASFDFGIVAINIDDLVPANHILRTPTQETMSQHISILNDRFLKTHERHFRKYLAGDGSSLPLFPPASWLMSIVDIRDLTTLDRLPFGRYLAFFPRRIDN
jgi:hypothetical protein